MDVTNYIEGLATEDRFAGAVIIALNGEPLMEKAYGLAERSRNISNQVDTKFNLVSLNKMGYTIIILSNPDGGCLSVREFIRENPLRTTP